MAALCLVYPLIGAVAGPLIVTSIGKSDSTRGFGAVSATFFLVSLFLLRCLGLGPGLSVQLLWQMPLPLPHTGR